MNNIDFIINDLKKKGLQSKSSKEAKIVFVGGIPGAGKDLLIEKTKDIFSDDEFNVIDVDLYRRYLGINILEETIDEANKIVMELFEFYIQNKKNIIIVGTLRSFDHLDNLISNELIPNNYQIYFNIIVTNRIEATLSTYERYVTDKEEGKVLPRLNKLDFLEAAYYEFHEAMRKYSSKEYFKNHRLFIRGDNLGKPKELPITGNLDEFIKDEELRQIKLINKEDIIKRINIVKSKLTEKEEIDEFNLVCDKILNVGETL